MLFTSILLHGTVYFYLLTAIEGREFIKNKGKCDCDLSNVLIVTLLWFSNQVTFSNAKNSNPWNDITAPLGRACMHFIISFAGKFRRFPIRLIAGLSEKNPCATHLDSMMRWQTFYYFLMVSTCWNRCVMLNRPKRIQVHNYFGKNVSWSRFNSDQFPCYLHTYFQMIAIWLL